MLKTRVVVEWKGKHYPLARLMEASHNTKAVEGLLNWRLKSHKSFAPFRRHVMALLVEQGYATKAEVKLGAQQLVFHGTDMEGGDLFGFFRDLPARVVDAFKGARMDYRPSVRDFLAKNGQQVITRMSVSRAPIQSFINKALDAVTFGKWSETKQKHGYDKFFHLGLIVEFGTPTRRCVIEKNEVINISTGYKNEQDAEFMEVLLSAPITIQQLLDACRAKMGDADFFLYDAFKNNCQVFIRALLDASGLLTPQLDAFIFQPVDKVLGDLPNYTSKVARAITDLGAKADIVLSGRGVDDALLHTIVGDLVGSGLISFTPTKNNLRKKK